MTYRIYVEREGLRYICRWNNRQAGPTASCGHCGQGVIERLGPRAESRAVCLVCGATRIVDHRRKYPCPTCDGKTPLPGAPCAKCIEKYQERITVSVYSVEPCIPRRAPE